MPQKNYFSNTAMLVTNKQCHFDMFHIPCIN